MNEPTIQALSFVELLSKIPDVVWAAIIASLITLGGIYLSNKNSGKQLNATLNHATKQLKTTLDHATEQLNTTLNHGTTQLDNRLNHEATQKNREREILLRQEVYIATAEAIPRSLATLINLSNLDIPMQQSADELQMFSAVIAKIHMVGNNNTVQYKPSQTL